MRTIPIIWLVLALAVGSAAGCGQTEREGWEAFCNAAPADLSASASERQAQVAELLHESITNERVLDAFEQVATFPLGERRDFLRSRIYASGVEHCKAVEIPDRHRVQAIPAPKLGTGKPGAR